MTGVKRIVTEWESKECYLRSDEHGGPGPGYLSEELFGEKIANLNLST